MKTLSLLFVVILLSACGATEIEDPERGGGADDSTVGLTFVSGHFGSYWDCPEDAFQTPSDGDGQAAERDSGPGAVAGDCADDTDCGGFLNCTSAQLTLQIENTGDAEIRGIHIREIQVLGSEGEVVAALPVLSVDTVEMDGFQGRLGADTTATLRIDFQGPRQLRDILGDGQDRAPVRVIIEVDAQKPAGIETPELEALGQIAT